MMKQEGSLIPLETVEKPPHDVKERYNDKKAPKCVRRRVEWVMMN